MGPNVPFEGEERDPPKDGQGTAPPRGAVACVSQSWTVPLKTTIAEGVVISAGGTREEKVWLI
jgi:hypothetical protein